MKNLFQRIHLCLIQGFGPGLFLVVQQANKYTENSKELTKRRKEMLKQIMNAGVSFKRFNVKGTTKEEKREE